MRQPARCVCPTKTPRGRFSTENATLARTLLADLVDRGLDPEQAILRRYS
jgi:hypothetical protein